MKTWKDNNMLLKEYFDEDFEEPADEEEADDMDYLTADEVDSYIYEMSMALAQKLIDKNTWAGRPITKARANYPFFWYFGNCITKVEEKIKDRLGYYEDLPEDLEMYLHDEVPYVFWDALKKLSDKDSVWNNVTEKDLRLDGWRVEK